MAKRRGPLVMTEVTEGGKRGDKISNLSCTVNMVKASPWIFTPTVFTSTEHTSRSFPTRVAALEALSRLPTPMGLRPWLSQPCVECEGWLQDHHPLTPPNPSNTACVEQSVGLSTKCWTVTAGASISYRLSQSVVLSLNQCVKGFYWVNNTGWDREPLCVCCGVKRIALQFKTPFELEHHSSQTMTAVVYWCLNHSFNNFEVNEQRGCWTKFGFHL